MRLKETLRSLRDGKGWTQAQLAKKSGVHRVTIAEIETGTVSDPRSATIKKLARALNCKPYALLGGEYSHGRA